MGSSTQQDTTHLLEESPENRFDPGSSRGIVRKCSQKGGPTLTTHQGEKRV